MKQATLCKFGLTKNVEHRGNSVQLSGPSFTEEKLGIYSCICQKNFKTKAGLTMHKAWCKMVVSTNKNWNGKSELQTSPKQNQLKKKSKLFWMKFWMK